jgi:hypothetical protein
VTANSKLAPAASAPASPLGLAQNNKRQRLLEPGRAILELLREAVKNLKLLRLELIEDWLTIVLVDLQFMQQTVLHEQDEVYVGTLDRNGVGVFLNC